jgi:hypothetical protein
MPKPKWLIEGLFEVNKLVMLAGPPASFKSFLALDWLLSIATGRSWFGRKCLTAKVLYVLGEGKSGLLSRLSAWAAYNKVSAAELERLKLNFRVTFDVPQMAMKSSVDNMLADLEDDGFKPEVIVLDTFARSFVGLDENSQQDTGLWIESAERLRDLGYTVIFLHHTAKNTEFGLKYRGSSAIMGAMDTAITLQRDGTHKTRAFMNVVKQKDHDEGDPMTFQALNVRTSLEDDGSIVLTHVPTLDERFAADERKINGLLMQLVEDASFESDRARARELARQCGLTESAAQTRVSRHRKMSEADVEAG